MPPYECKAMIPELAYAEAPGDKIEVLAVSGEKLGEYVVPASPAAEYSISLAAAVRPRRGIVAGKPTIIANTAVHSPWRKTAWVRR